MSNPNPNPHKRFKKGQSGNLSGRPKGSRSMTTLFKEMLIKIGDGNTEAYDALLTKRIFKMAIVDGNEQMIKLLVSYVDGLPPQSVDLTTGGKELPVPIINLTNKE